MKKKKLTINSLAFGNLKSRKKQYIVMIIGIILSMVFSSSVIISLFSLNATQLEAGRRAVGIQNSIVLNVTEEGMNEAKDDGYLDEIGYAHMVGYITGNSAPDALGVYMCWLDDKAKELSYQDFIEGTYPTSENEIAIEQSALIDLGIDAKVGDEINLNVFPQNKQSHLDTYNQKTYKLVGIAEDKKRNIDGDIPAAFVCENTQTDAGGKESLVSYVTFTDFEYDEVVYYHDYYEGDIYFDGYQVHVTRSDVFQGYINEKYGFGDMFSAINENNDFLVVYTNYKNAGGGQTTYSLETNIIYLCIIGAVLSLSSCIAIVNSFNSNLKDRKQQIGMLRAVGTTKKQIITILGREAFIISLICIPVSLVISYLIVLALSLFMNDALVIKIDVLSIIICGIVGIATVMTASLIPIILSTRITPMQAIRNVDIVRKMKNKKVKSLKSFSVSKLLAKRYLTFHKGLQISVIILLTVIISFSCVGFSFISYSKEFERASVPVADYYLHNGISGGFAYTASKNAEGGISDADRQAVSSLPYISKSFGVKYSNISIIIDEYTDYYKALSNVFDDSKAAENIVTHENYAEMCRKDFREMYSDIKNQLGFEKEFYPTEIYAVDEWKLETLSSHLTSGEINLDKLASGEEVILVAPQKAGIQLRFYNNGQNFYENILTDNKLSDKSKCAVYGEQNYKAGDSIDLSILYGNSDDLECTEDKNIYHFDRVDKKAKIGAVISPDYFVDENGFLSLLHEEIIVLTSIAGMNRFINNVKYETIYFDSAVEINDEINETIINRIQPIQHKTDSHFYSYYESDKNLQEEINSFFVALASLIIIAFSVCAAIINNTFTASIRERKKELGTLRAVGISRKEFVSSYVRQLLFILGTGYISGFSVFAAGFTICHIVVYFKNKFGSYYHESEVPFLFNPWITIICCIILFAVCSLNLWLKIRKEMKNSIIENIREL